MIKKVSRWLKHVFHDCNNHKNVKTIYAVIYKGSMHSAPFDEATCNVCGKVWKDRSYQR